MSAPAPASVELHRFRDVGSAKRTVEIVESPPFERDEDGERWMRQVASEATAVQTHFFRRDGKAFAWWPSDSEADGWSPDGVKVLAADLLRRTLVEPGSTIPLRRKDDKTRSLRIPAEAPRAPDAVEQVYTPAGLEAQIAADVERTLPRLARQLRSPLGLMPFVGAGMSVPFGLPQWGEFLATLADQFVDVDGELARLRASTDVEALAEQLWKRNQNAFQNAIEERFDRTLDATRLGHGPLATLARLVDGPVITTNFDHVLEDAFVVCGRAFDDAVHGAKPDRIVSAIHQQKRHLLKIHGDCRDRADRTFTVGEYERSYAQGSATLSSLGLLMFTHRPLLFLGCSLERDRTVDVLKKIQLELAGIAHFAVLAAKYRPNGLRARREELAAMGIVPLWFAPGDFGRIERHLALLLEVATSRELRPAAQASRRSVARKVARRAAPKRRNGTRPIAGTTQTIASSTLDGRVAFLLGNFVHLGAVRSGDAFYAAMAKHFRVPHALRDRSEIARFVLDRHGLDMLFDWYRAFIDVDGAEPSTLVQLLVELSRRLRSTRSAGITLITTNYDLVLERALEAADEPFHVFYYLNGGPDDGRFVYRSPDGAVRVVERPDRFDAPRDEHACLVKLNGGLVHDEAIPHSVCIARGDFERLAARLPACLPAGVRARLESRSLLCLGHGLYELDVEYLIRHVHSSGPRRVSWAIQKVPPRFKADFATRREYWRPIGLELVEQDLTEFADELARALAN